MKHAGYTEYASAAVEDGRERALKRRSEFGFRQGSRRGKERPATRTSQAGLVEMQNARRVRNGRGKAGSSLDLLVEGELDWGYLEQLQG